MLTIVLTALLLVEGFQKGNGDCDVASISTASGTNAPSGKICSGDLIFEENFENAIDTNIWKHSNTLSGCGNGEFEWYTADSKNSHTKNGLLHIKPTLLADEMGENYLYSGTINITDICTDTAKDGCLRTGTKEKVLNPVKSAKISTNFYFKYGKMEVRARTPGGDWLWPAIWLLPKSDVYGHWPISGEIDLMESKGNKDLVKPDGTHIGNQIVTSTLIWGPTRKYKAVQGKLNNSDGFNADFHRYQMTWTDKQIEFSVDDTVIKTVVPPEGGFWELGEFDSTGLDNPWKNATIMAPFDQEFHIILNTAIGGTNGYFADSGVTNAGGKPWKNSDGNAITEFWEGRDQWLPTWNEDTLGSHFHVDYVRVWAL